MIWHICALLNYLFSNLVLGFSQFNRWLQSQFIWSQVAKDIHQTLSLLLLCGALRAFYRLLWHQVSSWRSPLVKTGNTSCLGGRMKNTTFPTLPLLRWAHPQLLRPLFIYFSDVSPEVSPHRVLHPALVCTGQPRSLLPPSIRWSAERQSSVLTVSGVRFITPSDTIT